MRTRWRQWTPEQRREFLGRLDAAERERLLELLNAPEPGPAWETIARPEQLPPAGEWLLWLYMAGRGAGKTRAAAEWAHARAQASPGCRIALVGRTPADVRDVMIEGDSGILTVARDDRPVYQPTKRRLSWPNGSTAYTYSAEVPAQLRGPQHHYAWCVPAGTLVRSEMGERPIRDIRAGERVWTRAGLRVVEWSGCTRRNVEVVEIETASGEVLRATPDHRIWVQGTGWKPAGSVVPGDRLMAWNDSPPGLRRGTTGTAAAGGATGVATTRTEPVASCMLRSGSASTDADSRRVTSSTTPTMTRRTTMPATWNASRLPSIPGTTFRDVPTIIRGSQPRTQRLHVSGPAPCGRPASHTMWSALSAASHTRAPACGPDSAVTPALRVTAVVRAERSPSRVDVYDVAVADEHEFFANDVLVHNCDEPASWTDARKGDVLDTAWNNLMLGLRLGRSPRCVATTTPKPITLIRTLLGRASTVVTRGSTYDNLDNLAPSFREEVLAAYEGTRIGRQELLGELLEDVEGALWTLALIDEDRVTSAPDMRRVVVAVDPSGGDGPDSDEQGIVVAGLGVDGELYVLADRSCKLSPHGWASRAIGAFHEFKADRVVAEVNYGGAMVESTIRQVSKTVPIKVISASRGKVQRAEPVAAAYEQHRVHHVGAFPKLEDQLTTWTPADGTSPDRLDALVWAVTELTDNFSADAWIAWAKRKAEEAASPEPRDDPETPAEPEPVPVPPDPAEARRAARNAAYMAQREGAGWR